MNQNENRKINEQPVKEKLAEIGDLEPNQDVKGGGDKLPPPTIPISAPPPRR